MSEQNHAMELDAQLGDVGLKDPLKPWGLRSVNLAW